MTDYAVRRSYDVERWVARCGLIIVVLYTGCSLATHFLTFRMPAPDSSTLRGWTSILTDLRTLQIIPLFIVVLVANPATRRHPLQIWYQQIRQRGWRALLRPLGILQIFLWVYGLLWLGIAQGPLLNLAEAEKHLYALRALSSSIILLSVIIGQYLYPLAQGKRRGS